MRMLPLGVSLGRVFQAEAVVHVGALRRWYVAGAGVVVIPRVRDLEVYLVVGKQLKDLWRKELCTYHLQGDAL